MAVKKITSEVSAGFTAVAIQDLLDRYGILLAEVDQWFANCQQKYPELIKCGNGCSSCCRGLFDITLMDALYLKRGLNLMTLEKQSAVKKKSNARLKFISSIHPDFTSPWLLNHLPEEKWDEIMPEEDEIPCVLLSSERQCLVYDYRPMTCRLNGIPLIDISGEELFDDWCTMNFSQSNPADLEELRHPFNELFTQELLLFRELTLRLYGTKISEVDTIIPAAIFLDQPEQLNRDWKLQS